MGCPLRLPLRPLELLPNIQKATRCTVNSDTQTLPTRQVIIEHSGPLPAKIDLWIWSTFYVRPYSAEPVRCYQCHKFGHTRLNCRNSSRCGICSKDHPISKYKAKEEITSKCPNCQGGHHAWNKSCPEWRRRIQMAIEGQQTWIEKHSDAPPGTFVWGKQRMQKTAPPPPPSSQEFPSLPSTQNPALSQKTTSLKKESVITLLDTALKNLLAGFALSISKLLNQNINQTALTQAVDSLVSTAISDKKQDPPTTETPSTAKPTEDKTQATLQETTLPQTTAQMIHLRQYQIEAPAEVASESCNETSKGPDQNTPSFKKQPDITT